MVDFVDPEMGMMDQASVRTGIRFSYLHIIADNIAEKCEESLSNERMEAVLSRRLKLSDRVQDVLAHHPARPAEKDICRCRGWLRAPPLPAK